MLKIYGNKRSRATRCWWALEELGLDYEVVDINHVDKETQKPDYLALNPAGKVPTLTDGDTVIFESIAINFYLAQTYKGSLWPDDAEAQALAIQWSFWTVAELEPPIVTLCMERVFKPEPARDAAKAAEAEETLKKQLDLLEGELTRKGGTLTNAGFTIADLNAAAVMRGTALFGFDVSPWPTVKSWFDAAQQRPAYQRAMAR